MKKTFILSLIFLASITALAQTKKPAATKATAAVPAKKPVDKFYLSEITAGGMGGEGIGTLTLSNGVDLLDAGEIKELFTESGEINAKYLNKKLKLFYKIAANKDKIVTKIEFVEEKIIDNKASVAVMLGTWTGDMGGKLLTIVIEKVEGTTLIGYNSLGTTKRPLKGTFTDGYWAQACSKAFTATLSEPGDDKWDGVFTITFVGYEDTKEREDGFDCAGNLSGSEANGSWKSNNGKMNKEFSLSKKK